MARTDTTYDAVRTSSRPIEYGSGGAYRVVTNSGAAASIGAGASGILASLWWKTASPFKFVLTRLAVNMEVLSNITAAPVFDVAAFITRNITAASSGSGSSTWTGLGGKMQGSMPNSRLVADGGELRTLGTTTALTAAAGKTNDALSFGQAYFGTLYNSSATGTAVLITVGAGVQPGGFQDLYNFQTSNHPIVLGQNDGLEIQTITANNTTGTVKYGFLFEWVETDKW